MTVRLECYARGEWVKGGGPCALLTSAIDGSAVAEISSQGLDVAGMLDYARRTGGPALRQLTFHQRALALKKAARYLLEAKDEFYAQSAATGATRTDSWIDIEGGIGTFFTYSGKGRRELPNARFYIDGDPEPLSRRGSFIGQHICVPLEGVAVHINAFNFPCWGMLEKLAPTLLAGVPAIVKPASQTAYLAQPVFRRLIESAVFPEGALQLICGGVGDLLDHLTCQDTVSFTGSAATGLKLKQHPAVIDNSVRFTMEADSLNCSILAPDAEPGGEEFGLYVEEVVREMTVKAGQRCTAIRRAIVPQKYAEALIVALRRRLDQVVVGDPANDGVTMGALASIGQRAEVRECVRELRRDGEQVYGDPDHVDALGADPLRGAFMGPQLLYCADPARSARIHDVEAFGPATTVMPYDTLGDAIELARRGRGSLVGSLFTANDDFAREFVLGAAAHHGRLLLVNRHCAGESTGHGSPLPVLVHGGPGRAGGGEEMGGIRGVLNYMQRSALQGFPETLARVTGKWLPGAVRREDSIHPFRKNFDELEIGDTLSTGTRTVTQEDVEHFARFTGDTFYAHMDEQSAKANPFFEGRVAHGYFIVSAAAGLFVDPDPGPVLANYGLDNLRFLQPVYFGDSLKVALTCKQKTARENESYGEVRWDTTVTNQDGRVVAQYDLLTMVARTPEPPKPDCA